jgi:A/G-specific adenine glycosylase
MTPKPLVAAPSIAVREQARDENWSLELRFGKLRLEELRAALLNWFDQHKRDLPWRRTRDPYAIWVSEIMLQQTRVAAVLDHYARWIERFPTVASLAAAEEADVLALWSGLGYYRRARFLHAGARVVIADHSGLLPRTAAGLRALPGIGEYTSAAIASIAFGEQVPVVDGNVERVVMRLAGLSPTQPSAPAVPPGAGKAESAPGAGKAESAPGAEPIALSAAPLARAIRLLAGELLDPVRPGDFNQAMMELGATICLPRAPLCLQCPAHAWCATRGEHRVAPRHAMQSREITYVLARRERMGAEEVLLAQRPAHTSLMPGMWELPEIAPAADSHALLFTLRHAITVTNYTVRVAGCMEEEAAALCLAEVPRWVPLAQLPDIALTGLARKALKRAALWPQPAAQ